MNIHIVTLFPEIFKPIFNHSIIKRAKKKKLVKIKIHNLRDWALDKHKTVDDIAYGGGAGMILKADIIDQVLYDIKKTIPKKSKSLILLTDPRGTRYTQKKAFCFSKVDHLVIICGHYGGVDERVIKLVDKSICVGDFVLTGGEIPAMAITDSIIRLIPGVINPQSKQNETFSLNTKKQFPQYTRPESLNPQSIKTKKNLLVPKVLLSGNHTKISQWRKSKSK